MFNKNIQKVYNNLYEEKEFDTLWSRDNKGKLKDSIASVTIIITPSCNYFKITHYKPSKLDDEYFTDIHKLKKRMMAIEKGE